MRCRCLRRGKGGNGVVSLGLDIEALADTVIVRDSHCGELLWRVSSSPAEKVLTGKSRLSFEKTEGSAESTQVFVVGDTRRKESWDGRGRRERSCVAGKAGEKVGWYDRTYTDLGCFL